MARNLLLRPAPPSSSRRSERQVSGEAELVVIDHQDLRLGPPLYDVASLLHDSTLLSAQQITRLEIELLEVPEREHYARVCAQRLFKIVGTFHAFEARGDGRHLSRVGPALRDALQQLGRLPEGADLAPALALRWAG